MLIPSLLIVFLTKVQAAPLNIMIDPGHGGVDKGAVRGKLQESEIALRVAGELAKLLRQDSRFQVSMTRTSDTKISLKRRTEMAKEAQADLFVSIHLNSSTDPRAHGKEIYFQNQLPADEDALFLASRENDEDEPAAFDETISKHSDLKRILEDLGRNQRIFSSSHLSKALIETWGANASGSRAIRQAPFQVITHNSIPSVLVEIGFLSHATEGPTLADEATQKTIAKGLYEGLVKYSKKEQVDNLVP